MPSLSNFNLKKYYEQHSYTDAKTFSDVQKFLHQNIWYPAKLSQVIMVTVYALEKCAGFQIIALMRIR